MFAQFEDGRPREEGIHRLGERGSSGATLAVFWHSYCHYHYFYARENTQYLNNFIFYYLHKHSVMSLSVTECKLTLRNAHVLLVFLIKTS